MQRLEATNSTTGESSISRKLSLAGSGVVLLSGVTVALREEFGLLGTRAAHLCRVHRTWSCVHEHVTIALEANEMPTPRRRSHKHFRLDAVKIKHAQKVLQAGTETEAIERALDLVISEHEKNRLAAEANERFVKSGIAVKDVYGTLEP